MTRVSICCANKPLEVPHGATVGRCSTCAKEIIYSADGLRKVRAHHAGVEVQLNCLDCLEVIATEELIDYRGVSGELP